MIEIARGDILKSDAEALVNTVNCVGVMGRGVALQFRNEFPNNFDAYKIACTREEVQPGKMFVFDLSTLQNPHYVINFPTKRHWKGHSRIEDIRSGLTSLVAEIKSRDIQSVAIPPLGCGLGGLNWAEVKPLIVSAFRELPDVTVYLYEPVGAPPAATMVKHHKAPNMTNGPATLLVLARQYLAAVMDPFVTLLELHKLMYFMQEAGEDLSLRYAKATYGPYAENLRHMLLRIDGYFITGYGDAEDDPEKQIELNHDAIGRADKLLRSRETTKSHVDRVVDLISGFETPYGMELLATVHWVASKEQSSDAEEAIARVYDWNPRKRMFSESHIRLAWDVLEKHGWLA